MSKTTITLPIKFDITQVKSLKERLQKALDKDAESVEINAQSVVGMDSSAVQLVLSFQKIVAAQNKKMVLVKTTDEFKKAIEMLGADELIQVV